MTQLYVHHRITTEPRQFQNVADACRRSGATSIAEAGGLLYGIWRSQIGRPRDELTVMTVWPDDEVTTTASEAFLTTIPSIRHNQSERMTPTLRPKKTDPPRRQGLYAFRWFETPADHWPEFLDLCTEAWQVFEAAYDSQVIGLWRSLEVEDHLRRSLLLTRRPNLAMWERSKIPGTEAEAEMRRKLSRR